MKTLQELYEEITANEELLKEFCALKPEEIEGFCEKHGCKATLNEVKRFVYTHIKNNGKVQEQLAGGKGGNINEAFLSVFTAGIGCAVKVIQSTVQGHSGTKISGNAMLCVG